MQTLLVRVFFYTLVGLFWLGCGLPVVEVFPALSGFTGKSVLIGVAWNQGPPQALLNTGISAALLDEFPLSSHVQSYFSRQRTFRTHPSKLGIFRIEAKSSGHLFSFLHALEKGGEVLFVEPNETYAFFSTPPLQPVDWKGLSLLYQEKSNWWTESIRLPEALAWLKSKASGSKESVVAVFDSGVDIQHVALMDGKIWKNPTPGAFGCKDDVWGCNTGADAPGFLGTGDIFPFQTSAYGEPCPTDINGPSGDCFHGTNVTGLVVGDVQLGGSGVCPVCRVLPVKVMDREGAHAQVTDEAFLKGLIYISKINEAFPGMVSVINASFGKKQRSRIIEFYISKLYEQGTLLVAAAGNEDTEERMFPAAFPQVVAVTALTRTGQKAAYANFGTWVDIAAPGGDDEAGQGLILSLVPGSGLTFTQGTSIAAPFVSGVLGLHAALFPSWSAEARRQALLQSSNPALYDPTAEDGLNADTYLVEVDGEKRPLLGHGKLDVFQFLQGQSASGVRGYEPLPERVQRGCGVVGLDHEMVEEGGLLWLLFLSPILSVAYFRRKIDGIPMAF